MDNLAKLRALEGGEIVYFREPRPLQIDLDNNTPDSEGFKPTEIKKVYIGQLFRAVKFGDGSLPFDEQRREIDRLYAVRLDDWLYVLNRVPVLGKWLPSVVAEYVDCVTVTQKFTEDEVEKAKFFVGKEEVVPALIEDGFDGLAEIVKSA